MKVMDAPAGTVMVHVKADGDVMTPLTQSCVTTLSAYPASSVEPSYTSPFTMSVLPPRLKASLTFVTFM